MYAIIALASSAWTPMSVAVEPASLSFERFDVEYASRGLPVVIRRGAAQWGDDARGRMGAAWKPSALRAMCGARPLVRMCDDGPASPSKSLNWFDPALVGHEWAGMADVAPASMNLSTLGDVLDAQQRGAALYLHDCSVDLLCPALFERLRAPSRWFPTDLLLQAPRHLGNFNRCAGHLSGTGEISTDDGAAEDQGVAEGAAAGAAENTAKSAANEERDAAASLVWPTLFVAPVGALTGLHVDAGSTRFWMAVLHGRKVFRLLHRTDGDYDWLHSLHAGSAGGTDDGAPPDASRLDADIFEPNVTRHPELGDPATTMYEAVVEAGDIVFVPNGIPHQVRNVASDSARGTAGGGGGEVRGGSVGSVELTIAVAYNYVDRHNFLPYATTVLQQHIDGDIDRDLLLWYLSPGFPRYAPARGEAGVVSTPSDGAAWADFAAPQLVAHGDEDDEELAALLRGADAQHRFSALVERVRTLSSLPLAAHPAPSPSVPVSYVAKGVDERVGEGEEGDDELLLRLAQLVDLFVEKAKLL